MNPKYASNIAIADRWQDTGESASVWFVLRHDQAVGPFSVADVRMQVSSGQLHALDLVSMPGDSVWRYLFSISEFSSIAQPIREVSQSSLAQIDELMPWVVLKQQTDGTWGQDGPFSTACVQAKLQQREFLFSDFAWRSGLQQWIRLRHLPDFGWIRNEVIELSEFAPGNRIYVPHLSVFAESNELALSSVFQISRKQVMASPFDGHPQFQALCG